MPKNGGKKENDIKFEIEFYEKILQESPNFIEALKLLAELYTKTGQFDKGLQLDKKLTVILPRDPIVFYNLSCSYSLMGDIDKALNGIKKAIELGYNDFNYMNSDPDLENLRKDKRFEEILSKNMNNK